MLSRMSQVPDSRRKGSLDVCSAAEAQVPRANPSFHTWIQETTAWWDNSKLPAALQLSAASLLNRSCWSCSLQSHWMKMTRSKVRQMRSWKLSYCQTHPPRHAWRMSSRSSISSAREASERCWRWVGQRSRSADAKRLLTSGWLSSGS